MMFLPPTRRSSSAQPRLWTRRMSMIRNGKSLEAPPSVMTIGTIRIAWKTFTRAHRINQIQSMRMKMTLRKKTQVLRTRFYGSFLLVAACLIAGCNSANQSASPDGKAGAGAGKRHKVAFVTNNASEFWTIARKGTEKAEAEIQNIKVEFRIPGEGTAAEQQRIVDDLLASGVEGFAISPVDPANQTQMLNRAASQALVVTQDSDAANSNRACYVGTDNVAAGRQAGQLVKE